MKKSILVLFLAVIAFQAQAQKIKVGANAGATYSSLRGNGFVESQDAGFGFLVGLNVEYKIKENLSVRVNPAFERNTVVDHGPIVLFDGVNGGSIEFDPKIRTNYDFISLPVMLKYDLKNSSWFLNGGLFFNYLVKAKAAAHGDIPEGFPADDADFTDGYKKINTGIAFGFGKAIKLDKKNNLTIEIRENLGLSNISKGNLGVKTNALHLSVGWSFDWK